MSELLILLLLALFQQPAQPALTCKDSSMPKLVHDAQVVVAAEVVEVKPALGVWSGLFLVVQRVRYEVKDVLKGDLRERNINVGHYIVANSSTADAKEARLSPKIFTKGARVVLFLTADPGEGYLSSPNESNEQGKDKAYLAIDSTCGLTPADIETLKYIKQYTLPK